jgi:hypothetical protein
MGVEIDAGYTWTNGTHARLLHEGNRFPIKTITATDDIGTTADLVDNDLTIDKWKPFANLLTDPSNFAGADWTATNVTVGADGQTITETAVSGAHDLEQSVTWDSAGGNAVFAIDVDRQSLSEVRLLAFDGTNTRTCWFDMRDLTVGSVFNATGQIIALGGDSYRLKMYFTANSAAGRVEIQFGNGSEATSYGGSVDNTIKITRAVAHAGEASLRLDGFTGQAGTCFGIAAHNLGSGGARITFEHDSNADDTFTTIEAITPTDDSPIMFFFNAVTSARWRITVDRGALPEIGVVRVGDPLVFERARYAGASPARMNRATENVGNISRSGELMGRSVKRTILKEPMQWPRLSYAWVRANLDGPNGVIQSLESNAAFLAWRPETIPDVAYIMRATADAPQATGQVNLWSFAIDAEVHSYE